VSTCVPQETQHPHRNGLLGEILLPFTHTLDRMAPSSNKTLDLSYDKIFPDMLPREGLLGSDGRADCVVFAAIYT